MSVKINNQTYDLKTGDTLFLEPDSIFLDGPATPKTQWVRVDPITASSWLSNNHEHNRKLMPKIVERYAADMREGKWVTTHQGIAIDTRGCVVDGQHRLHAVIVSGTTQIFLVTSGLSVEAVQAIDRGKTRTISHALQWLGIPMTQDIVAIINAMLQGTSSFVRKLRDSEVSDFFEKHMGVIVESRNIFPKKLGSAIFAGVIAKASYHHTRESLERFAAAVADSIPAEKTNENDRFVRKSMVDLRALSSGAHGMRVTSMKKFQRLLQTHLTGEKINKLYECNEDLFPLPNEG